MNAADEQALGRLLGNRGASSSTVGVDELQGLLLQITLAIMAVFIIAFFIFRVKSEAQRREEVLKLNRQKLVLAVDQVEAGYRARYGLSALLPKEGLAAFDASGIIRGTGLVDAPAVRNSFADGAKAAHSDYADADALNQKWRSESLTAAGLAEEQLSEEDQVWFRDRLAAGVKGVRGDVQGMQRACAAQLQCAWLAKPSDCGDAELAALIAKLKGADDDTRLLLATEISTALKTRSLARLSELAGSALLP